MTRSIATGFSAPRFDAFFKDYRRHDESRYGVGPPPSEKGIEQKTAE